MFHKSEVLEKHTVDTKCSINFWLALPQYIGLKMKTTKKNRKIQQFKKVGGVVSAGEVGVELCTSNVAVKLRWHF